MYVTPTYGRKNNFIGIPEYLCKKNVGLGELSLKGLGNIANRVVGHRLRVHGKNYSERLCLHCLHITYFFLKNT